MRGDVRRSSASEATRPSSTSGSAASTEASGASPGEIERLFVPIFHPGGVMSPRGVLLVVKGAKGLF